jgi:hypothetical protein
MLEELGVKEEKIFSDDFAAQLNEQKAALGDSADFDEL